MIELIVGYLLVGAAMAYIAAHDKEEWNSGEIPCWEALIYLPFVCLIWPLLYIHLWHLAWSQKA